MTGKKVQNCTFVTSCLRILEFHGHSQEITAVSCILSLTLRNSLPSLCASLLRRKQHRRSLTASVAQSAFYGPLLYLLLYLIQNVCWIRL